jgi:hypothetical protein
MNKKIQYQQKLKISIVIHHNSNKFIITTTLSKIWEFLTITMHAAYIWYNDFGIYPLFIHIETITLLQVRVNFNYVLAK